MACFVTSASAWGTSLPSSSRVFSVWWMVACMVVNFSKSPTLFIYFCIAFRFFDHFINVCIRKATRGLNTDILFFCWWLCLLLLRGQFRWHQCQRSLQFVEHRVEQGDSNQVELTQHFIIRGHFTFLLEYPNGYSILVIFCSRECLWLFGRNSCVACNQTCKHAAQCFNTKWQWRNIKQRTSLTSPCKTPPWTAAPSATTSSGLTPLCGSLPKSSFTISIIFGIRVMPPLKPLHRFRRFQASIFQKRLYRVRLFCGSDRLPEIQILHDSIWYSGVWGPLASAVINGKLTSVWVVDDNSIFAFSAASFKRCRASLSWRRSMPCSFWIHRLNSRWCGHQNLLHQGRCLRWLI